MKAEIKEFIDKLSPADRKDAYDYLASVRIRTDINNYCKEYGYIFDNESIDNIVYRYGVRWSNKNESNYWNDLSFLIEEEHSIQLKKDQLKSS